MVSAKHADGDTISQKNLVFTKRNHKWVDVPNIEEKSQEDFQYLPNFLSTCLKFFFGYFLSPFYLKRVRTDKNGILYDEYVPKSWPPHSILCALLTILDFVWILRFFRTSLPGEAEDKNPAAHLQTIITVLRETNKLSFIWKLWVNRQAFANIVNFTLQSNIQVVRLPGWFKPKLLAGILMLLYAGIGLGYMDWFGGFAQNVDRSSQTFWIWWKRIVVEGRFNFFLSEIPRNATYMEFVNVLVGVLTFLGLLHRRILGICCDGLILMATLTLWIPAKAFAMTLQKSMKTHGQASPAKKLTWTCVEQKYLTLKQLESLINSTYGTVVTIFLVESMLAFSKAVDEVITTRWEQMDWKILSMNILYYTNVYTIILFAADITYQMHTLKSWLFVDQNRQQIEDQSKLFLILNDLSNNSVALKGSKVYPVTYSMLASQIGVTLTYYVVCVQFA